MNKSLLLISLTVICLFSLFFSCSKTINCGNGTLSIYAVGFTKTDFDSAVVVRYKRDNAFDSIADSSHLVSYSYTEKDSGSLVVLSPNVTNGSNARFLIPGYDYKIFLPVAGRTYDITNIVQRGNKTQSYSSGPLGGGTVVSCTNCIISCNLNGSPVAAPENLQSVPVYIVK
jgi:hypothetical protein